jgi:hypothetical protein
VSNETVSSTLRAVGHVATVSAFGFGAASALDYWRQGNVDKPEFVSEGVRFIQASNGAQNTQLAV